MTATPAVVLCKNRCRASRRQAYPTLRLLSRRGGKSVSRLRCAAPRPSPGARRQLARWYTKDTD